MILSDNLAIVLYTSTKGHFGQKNLFKHTVKRLEQKIPLFSDFFKLAHIKISPGEEEFGGQMANWLFGMGWKVKFTVGEWNHNNQSHAVGYYKDKLRIFSFPQLHKYKYTLFVEDDWLINVDENRTQILLDGALDFLDHNLDALCVRINNEKEEPNPADAKVRNFLYCQGLTRNQYGPTFTFQPTIVRTSEWYHSLRLINKNLHILEHKHCEIVSGEAMHNFSDSFTPFYYFDPKLISATHIGEEGMEDQLEKL